MIVAGLILGFTLFLVLILGFHRPNRKKLEKIAFIDPLTKEMNQAAFRLSYERLLPDMKPGAYTIIYLNVKGFKLINENFGIAAASDTLKYIYITLRNYIKEGELVIQK